MVVTYWWNSCATTPSPKSAPKRCAAHPTHRAVDAATSAGFVPKCAAINWLVMLIACPVSVCGIRSVGVSSHAKPTNRFSL